MILTYIIVDIQVYAHQLIEPYTHSVQMVKLIFYNQKRGLDRISFKKLETRKNGYYFDLQNV